MIRINIVIFMEKFNREEKSLLHHGSLAELEPESENTSGRVAGHQGAILSSVPCCLVGRRVKTGFHVRQTESAGDVQLGEEKTLVNLVVAFPYLEGSY